MSETPEIIESEIAALQAQIEQLKAVEAALPEPVIEPIVEPLAVEVASAPVVTEALQLVVITPTAQHTSVQPVAQTVPARWSLQPLAR